MPQPNEIVRYAAPGWAWDTILETLDAIVSDGLIRGSTIRAAQSALDEIVQIIFEGEYESKWRDWQKLFSVPGLPSEGLGLNDERKIMLNEAIGSLVEV